MDHPSGRGLLAGVLGLGALLPLVWLLSQPPSVRGNESPPDVFSAARAGALRAKLLEGLGPHRVGQPSLRQLRDRLLVEFQGLGLTPEVQSSFVCSFYGSCATVENLLFRIPGSDPPTGGRRAIMLAAHYDSVGAGPGASDDFNGTAAMLEIARILKSGPPLRNDVILLLTDGEETGLLGAHAFVRHPWANEVAAVINIEARGTSGLSHMFETGPDNAWLMALYARSVPRPSANSLAYAVYKRLPNDTDLTVFKAHGINGMNLANIGDVVHYHTPLDDLEHSDPRTLQHHGDTALALVKALAGTDLSAEHKGDAAYVDVLGQFVLRWPVGFTPVLAVLGLLLVVIGAWRGARQEPLTLRQLGWASLGWWWLLVSCLLSGLVVSSLLERTGAAPVPWIAHPAAAYAAFGLLLLAGLVPVCKVIPSRASPTARWASGWCWWALLVTVITFLAPEATPSFLLPVLIAGLAAVLAPLGRHRAAAVGVGTAGAGLFLLPVFLFLMDSMGLPMLAAAGLLIGLPLTSLLPLAPDKLPRAWTLFGALLGGAVVFAVWSSLLSPYSAQAPQRLNLVYRFEQDKQSSHWALEGDLSRVPEPLTEFRSGTRQKVTPWTSQPTAITVPVEAPALTAPELEPLRITTTTGGRDIEAQLRSSRGARILSVAFPPTARITSLRVNGETIPTPSERVSARSSGWRLVSCVADAPQGCLLHLVQEGSEPIEAFLTDESPGLPPGKFSRGVGEADFVPSQNGDVTITSRTVKL
ncbi:M28 family peptidase [Hyalangium versicolor]|uniref:M28 family peptidase n=1 Tax=Hyalangium versicolor TaxID=2861190 RepID=UPI001CC93C88|nr:M28 family peptidase [Hyalangium versicolor]